MRAAVPLCPRPVSPRPTNLTPNEQLTHMSLWALQAAPLLIGADMSQIDEWTINLLGNREVLAINQDPLGRAAGRVWADNWTQVWARELADLYFSGTTCLFVLHGNVHDLIRCPAGDGDTYCNLPEFLAAQVFGSWDVVLHHDLAQGLRPLQSARGFGATGDGAFAYFDADLPIATIVELIQAPTVRRPPAFVYPPPE